MNDPIVDGIRRVRDGHAARLHYDLDAIFRDIKEREKKSGRSFVSFGPTTGQAKQQVQQPNGSAATDSCDTARPEPALSREP